MFILRTVKQGGLVDNQEIEDHYQLILSKNAHTDKENKAFKAFSDLVFGALKTPLDVLGFISFDGVTKPLFYNHEYYIMTPDGGTFEKIYDLMEFAEKDREEGRLFAN